MDPIATTPAVRSAWSPALAAGMIEMRKMLAPRRLVTLLVLGVVATAIGIVSQAVGVAAGSGPDAASWGDRYLCTAFLRAVVPLATLYIGTSLWSEEVESGTLVYLITRPVSRPVTLLSKFAAAWLCTTAVIGVFLLGTGITLSVMGGTGLGALVGLCLLLPVTTFAWLAFDTLIGTGFSRTLIAGIAFGGGSELILANFSTLARGASVGHYVGSAALSLDSFAGVTPSTMVSGEPFSGFAAWTTLLGIGAVSLGLACLRVRYKEYAPTRSD